MSPSAVNVIINVIRKRKEKNMAKKKTAPYVPNLFRRTFKVKNKKTCRSSHFFQQLNESNTPVWCIMNPMKNTNLTIRIIVAVLAVFIALTAMACKQDPAPVEPAADEISFSSEINVMLAGKKAIVRNTYKTDYFRKDACTFDKDLALLSCTLAASTEKDNVIKAFDSMRFDNLLRFWNDDTDIFGCSYVFGHRKVDDYELVAVYLNWIDYDVEWAGNTTIGEVSECDGNHKGFTLAAEKAYAALKKYAEDNYKGRNLKIWITGYSRAAALTDVLACEIIEKKELGVKQSDLFAYSFEAPAALLASNSKEYQCIHNIVVEADLVAGIITPNYGLVRPGVDVVLDATPENINKCLHQVIGEEVSMPAFTPNEYYSNPTEFVDYFMTQLQAKCEEHQEGYAGNVPGLESRARFCSSVQERLSYLVEVLMKGSRAGLNALAGYAKEKTIDPETGEIIPWAALSLVSTWTGTDGFYSGDENTKGLKQILDACGTTYDDAKLKNACSIVEGLKYNNSMLSTALEVAATEYMRNNLMYGVSCHYPEVFYSLLNNYQ